MRSLDSEHQFSFILNLELITTKKTSHLSSLSKRDREELGNGLLSRLKRIILTQFFKARERFIAIITTAVFKRLSKVITRLLWFWFWLVPSLAQKNAE